MNNNRRRNFRSNHKNNFRRRNSPMNSNGSNNLSNGNISFNRNGSMNNIHNVENNAKISTTSKGAQSNGILFSHKITYNMLIII